MPFFYSIWIETIEKAVSAAKHLWNTGLIMCSKIMIRLRNNGVHIKRRVIFKILIACGTTSMLVFYCKIACPIKPAPMMYCHTFMTFCKKIFCCYGGYRPSFFFFFCFLFFFFFFIFNLIFFIF